MALYLISYDLRKVRNYDELYKLLELWKAKRLLESLWLADLKGPSTAIAQFIRSTLDGDDGIAVIELKKTGDWVADQAQVPGINWLQANLNP